MEMYNRLILCGQKIDVLILFLIFTITCTIAQNETKYEDQHLYVLQKELKTTTADSVQARLHIDISTHYLNNSELDSCVKYARLALRLIKTEPEQLNLKTIRAQAFENLGFGISKYRPQQGLDTLLVAQDLWRELKNDEGLGNTYLYSGIIYSSLGDFSKALKQYEKCLSIFEKTGRKGEQALTLMQLGITQRYMGKNGDALESTFQSLKLARELKDTITMTDALLANGFNYAHMGKFNEARQAQREALELSIASNDSSGISTSYNDLAVTAEYAGDLVEALQNHKAALKIRKQLEDYTAIGISYGYIAIILKDQGKLDEALMNAKEAVSNTLKSGDYRFITQSYIDIGEIYVELGDYELAEENLNYSLSLAREKKSVLMEVSSLISLGKVFRLSGKTNSALQLLRRADSIASGDDFQFRSDIYEEITATYLERDDYKNAYENHVIYKELNDSLISLQKAEKITKLTQNLIYENEQALQKASQDKEIAIKESQIQVQKFIRNLSIIGLLAGIVISIILFIKFKEKRKLSLSLEKVLNNLKATQSQLIQSEKMASLGELTAGIAHEIQNPLNFVTNFSEVSNELLEEMNEEIEKGDFEEAKFIASDIKQNLEKINHHGKRADAIVKGMLQHSRKSTDQKELTDINKLADEYLRLAYHGLRAKDKSFNAILETNFDESIGVVNVIPQDIGRVILNLITNAFYVVNKRKTLFDKDLLDQESYKPTVTVTTRKVTNAVEIVVRDNGSGIPQEVVDKIFQPFFTTKPTGEGTGLGLSMSYDIVKAHNGELSVTTKENCGTDFIIQLPLNS